jgi:hypothetical protein
MADITEFPDLGDLMTNDDSIVQSEKGPFQKFTFAVATKADQVVVYTTTSGVVTPSTGAVTEKVAGVAIADVAAGKTGTVAMAGNIMKVVNADDTTAINPGTWIQTNDNVVKGTVSAISLTASGALAIQYLNTVGITTETIPAGGSGYALIMPVPITVPNAS